MKKLLQMTLIFVILCSLISTLSLTAAADDPPTEGQCGDAIWWYINGSDLYFVGRGDMWDYTTKYREWEIYRFDVKNVYFSGRIGFEGGIRLIGGLALRNFYELENVYMPSVEVVSNGAFSYCHKLVNIAPKNVTHIGHSGFYGCGSLEAIRLPKIKWIDKYAFWHCSNLKRVALMRPEYIGDCAFGMCHPDLTFYYYITEQSIGASIISSDAYNGEEGTDPLVPTIYYPGDDAEWNQQIQAFPGITWKEWNPPFGHLLQCETYELENGKKEVAFAAIDLEEDCEIIIGLFKGDKLVSVQVVSLKEEEYDGETFTVTDNDDCDYVKVMVWTDLLELTPVETPIKPPRKLNP